MQNKYSVMCVVADVPCSINVITITNDECLKSCVGLQVLGSFLCKRVQLSGTICLSVEKK
jgi:hypothetical protein